MPSTRQVPKAKRKQRYIYYFTLVRTNDNKITWKMHAFKCYSQFDTFKTTGYNFWVNAYSVNQGQYYTNDITYFLEGKYKYKHSYGFIPSLEKTFPISEAVSLQFFVIKFYRYFQGFEQHHWTNLKTKIARTKKLIDNRLAALENG